MITAPMPMVFSCLLSFLGLGAPQQQPAAPAPQAAAAPAPAPTPAPTSGPALPATALTREVIQSHITPHIGELRACYDGELVARPDLRGRVTVQLIIASGDVAGATVAQTTLKSPRLEGCLLAQARRWKFPKSPTGDAVIVAYPFGMFPGGVVIEGNGGGGMVDIRPINETTFAFRAMDDHAESANGLVAITPQGLLLVDTAWTEAQTEAVLAWGTAQLRRPVIGAVVTHDHGDRAAAVAALRRRSIPVAAGDLTVAKLAARGVRNVGVLFAARAGAFADPRGFEAFYPGPSHTRDNIVLRFGDVLFGGGLLESREATALGMTADADLLTWSNALGRVTERYRGQVKVVVPGHGEFPAGAEDGTTFDHTLSLLQAAPAHN
jgi:metallo-beta-lactamase class B